MKKGYAKLLLPIVTMVVIFAGISVKTSAARKDAYIEFTTTPALSISLSSDDVSIENLIPGTADDSNEISVVVSTNSDSGYTLNAVAGTTDNNSTNLIHVDSSVNDTFTSITPGISVNAITEDRTWGFSTDHGATYSGMPIFYTDTPAQIYVTDVPSIDEIPFLIGARANKFQAPGEYRNIVTFTATVNPVPDTIATTRYMQDINDDVYASMEMEKQYQLIDKRDNKKYWVAKLQDGNVWMTQNLNFELVAPSMTLYPDTSNTGTPVTIQVSATRVDEKKGTLGWIAQSSFYDATAFYPSNISPDTYISGGVFKNEESALTPDFILESTEDLDGDSENWHYAVGGRYFHIDGGLLTGTTAFCPKGWSLPNTNTYGDVEMQYSINKLLQYYPYLGAAPTYLTATPYESSYAYQEYSEWDDYLNSVKLMFTDGVRYVYVDYDGKVTTTSYVYGGGGYNRFASIRCVALRSSVYPFTYYMNLGTDPDVVYYHYEPASWGGADASIRAVAMDEHYGIPFGKGEFLGWATDPSATEPDYVPGDIVVTNMGTENNLYAVWEQLSTTFDDAFAAAGKTKYDGEHYAMQDMTPEICAATSTNMATELVDTRNGNVYSVAKLKRTKEGSAATCWMIENLSLGSTTESYELTPDDTNISTNFTLSAVASAIESSNTIQFYEESGTDNFGGYAGTYYNFYTATAGTNDAKVASLCPKGWYIPGAVYSWYDDFNYHSFYELKEAYDEITNEKTFDTNYRATWTSGRHISTDDDDYGRDYINVVNNNTYMPSTLFAKIRCVVKPNN